MKGVLVTSLLLCFVSIQINYKIWLLMHKQNRRMDGSPHGGYWNHFAIWADSCFGI